MFPYFRVYQKFATLTIFDNIFLCLLFIDSKFVIFPISAEFIQFSLFRKIFYFSHYLYTFSPIFVTFMCFCACLQCTCFCFCLCLCLCISISPLFIPLS